MTREELFTEITKILEEEMSLAESNYQFYKDEYNLVVRKVKEGKYTDDEEDDLYSSLNDNEQNMYYFDGVLAESRYIWRRICKMIFKD